MADNFSGDRTFIFIAFILHLEFSRCGIIYCKLYNKFMYFEDKAQHKLAGKFAEDVCGRNKKAQYRNLWWPKRRYTFHSLV